MPGVVRRGDNCSGHSCYPPRPAATWSPNVYVNNREVERRTDLLQEHCCLSCHAGNYVGVHNVYANNLDIQTIGDAITCGSTCAQGSGNVFVN